MRRPHAFLALLIMTVLAGCSRVEFRTPALNREQALAHTEAMEMKIVKVWSVVADALDHDRDAGISHFIEVDVTAGSLAGKSLTLPLDDWNVKPPAEGSTVVVAPADWVRRNKDGHTRPFGGWN